MSAYAIGETVAYRTSATATTSSYGSVTAAGPPVEVSEKVGGTDGRPDGFRGLQVRKLRPEEDAARSSKERSQEQERIGAAKRRQEEQAARRAPRSGAATASQRQEQRVARFTRCVRGAQAGQGAVSWDLLRQLSYTGIPENHGMRCMAWKLLLGFLPLERSEWQAASEQQRSTYRDFCADLIVDPQEDDMGGDPLGGGPTAARLSFGGPGDGTIDGESTASPQKKASAPSPLSALPEAGGDGGDGGEELSEDDADREREAAKRGFGTDKTKWDAYFADSDLREEIQKDVDRTHTDIAFFATERDASRRDEIGASPARKRLPGTHYDAMLRILFVYAKLNPGIRYVQGMNEILAPIYYVFAKDEYQSLHAEADSFWCFTLLMVEIRDGFCVEADRADFGIQGRIRALNMLLKVVDRELWEHLERHSLNPQFYSLRWLSLLVSQEFSLPDTLRLWDSLLAARGKDGTGSMEFVYYFCCAMLVSVRAELLAGDFAVCLQCLQKYPPVDVSELLGLCTELKKAWSAEVTAQGTLVMSAINTAAMEGSAASAEAEAERQQAEIRRERMRQAKLKKAGKLKEEEEVRVEHPKGESTQLFGKNYEF